MKNDSNDPHDSKNRAAAPARPGRRAHQQGAVQAGLQAKAGLSFGTWNMHNN